METQNTVNTPVEVKKKEYASQIEAWKRKYGKVRLCLIEDEKAAFFRLPSRAEMQCAENLAFGDDGKFDAHKKAERLIADCFLGGDYTREQIDADIEVYTPLSRYVITKLVEEKKRSRQTVRSSTQDCCSGQRGVHQPAAEILPHSR